MKVVVVMTCNESNLKHVNDCVDSLLNGVSPPTEILITFQKGVKIPLAIKDNKIIRTSWAEKNYGQLSGIVDAIKYYPNNTDTDTCILYLNCNCTYPSHLINEYVSCLPDLNKHLFKETPINNGCIYGLAGIKMINDKKRNLDLEFQQLLGKSEITYETRNVISGTENNSLMDYLECWGSILMHSSQFKADFIVYLDKVTDNGKNQNLSMDIVLSNYFAKHDIHRAQMCTLFINRYMMQRSGCSINYKELSKDDKKILYEDTIKHLRSNNSFYTYE